MRPDLCATDNKINPRKYMGSFYTDSLVHDPLSLKLLMEVIGKVVILILISAAMLNPLQQNRHHTVELQQWAKWTLTDEMAKLDVSCAENEICAILDFIKDSAMVKWKRVWWWEIQLQSARGKGTTNLWLRSDSKHTKAFIIDCIVHFTLNGWRTCCNFDLSFA